MDPGLDWPQEEMLLWGEVMSFTEAMRLLSERYFAGEELLYPNARRALDATLGFLAGMRTSYRQTLAARPPESDGNFILWMARDGSDREQEVSTDDTSDDIPRPRVKRAARALAKHVVLVARAEALDDLGERDAGVRLVADWMRSDEGQQRLADARDPIRAGSPPRPSDSRGLVPASVPLVRAAAGDGSSGGPESSSQ